MEGVLGVEFRRAKPTARSRALDWAAKPSRSVARRIGGRERGMRRFRGSTARRHENARGSAVIGKAPSANGRRGSYSRREVSGRDPIGKRIPPHVLCRASRNRSYCGKKPQHPEAGIGSANCAT